MSIFATMLGLSADEYIKQGDEYYNESRFGEAKIEYEKAEELLSSADGEKKAALTGKISECREKLSEYHSDTAKNYEEATEYEKAIDEYETALELCAENSPRYTPLRKALDHARIKHYQTESDKLAEPLIEKGDEFMKENSFNEALVEYREALKLLKYSQDIESGLKRSAHDKLVECEIKIVQPYIERAKNFIETKLFEEALNELAEAREILEDDNKTRQTIDKLILDARKQKGLGEESSDEEFISKQEWDEAMDDYKELLNLYFSYSYNDSDPFQPIHQNKYEEGFKQAKKQLGTLYIKRADGHFNRNKFAVALKYYVESEKFFEDGAAEINYLKEKIENCKNNIK